MEATNLVIGIEGALAIAAAILGGAYGMWWRLSGEMKKLSDDITNLDTKLSGEIKSLDTKLSDEIKEVRLASEAAHKEINEKLNAIEVTQARHSERFNTVNEQFNAVGERFNAVNERLSAVQTQIQSVDDKVDRLREGK